MFRVGLGCVIGGAVKAVLPVVADKFAGRIQSDVRIANGIAGEFGFRDRYTINGRPFLGPEIEKGKFNAGKIGSQPAEHSIQTAILADFCKGRIRLRRVADRDRTFAL